MTPNGPTGRKAAIVGIALTSIGLAAAGLMLRPASGARPAPQFVSEPPRELSAQAVRPASELSDAFIAVSEAVTSAVVRIEAEHSGAAARNASWFSRSLPEFFDAQSSPDSASTLPDISGGSGFIVTSNGYILTNYHVIEGADRITVSLADKRTFIAQVIGADPSTDVAVIRIDAENLPAVALGDSDASRVGEWVLAIGNPGFDDASTLDFTVTSGIISAKGRPLDVLHREDTNYEIEDFIQTDAVINPGNSGGPLVDIKGRVIGINTAIATTTGYNQGYGFAIPMNLAQRVMRDLIAHGYVRRALLRVSIRAITPEDADVYKLPRITGVLVEHYEEGSPAHAAGLNRSDVIVAVDGTAIESVGQLQRLIAVHQPGETVTLSTIRFGEPRTVRVRLAEEPSAPLPRNGPPALVRSGLGIEVADLDVKLARDLGYDRASGAIVSKVLPGSVAQRKDVREGDMVVSINQQPVSSAREARRLLQGVASGKIVSLLFREPGGTTYITNIRVP